MRQKIVCEVKDAGAVEGSQVAEVAEAHKLNTQVKVQIL